ncbi:MAG: periplasmic heavy metal sensor [Gemmatimonadetes bacterium]|nr:periplasmic heavy metal sensor [Gemmatimonadota bacterium]
MLTRSHALAAILLIATFAAGAVVGGAASAAWGGGRGRDGPDNRRREGGFAGVLQRELSLSPAQRDSVYAILRRHDPAMRAVWDAMRPRFDSIRARVNTDINGALSPQQQAAFQRFLARQDSTQAARRRNRGDSAR